MMVRITTRRLSWVRKRWWSERRTTARKSLRRHVKAVSECGARLWLRTISAWFMLFWERFSLKMSSRLHSLCRIVKCGAAKVQSMGVYNNVYCMCFWMRWWNIIHVSYKDETYNDYDYDMRCVSDTHYFGKIAGSSREPIVYLLYFNVR